MTPLRIRSAASSRAWASRKRMTKARARDIALTLRPTAGQALLTLPEPPPSANALFANAAKGRVMTTLYRAWLTAAIQDLRQVQHAPLVKGRIKVAYVIERPKTARRVDLGNFEKALSDLLVKAEVIEDDSLIEEIILRWGDVKGVQISVGQA